MVLVTFIYKGENKTFEENTNSKMKDIFKKFSIYSKVSLESIIFLYNGIMINKDSELKDLLSDINQNELKILVHDKNNNEQNVNSNIILSKYPICRECGGIIRIDIKDYKINLFECDKGHVIKGLTFEEYIEMQKLDETKIICDNCKKTNKAMTFKKQFYKCISCKMNLCPLCESQHNKSHGIISYDEKDYNCQIHNDIYNSYCNNCKKNICIECEDEHEDHDIISMGKFFPNKNNLKIYYKEVKDKIDKFNELIKGIFNKINEVVTIINIYYNIINNHIEIYKKKKKNYQIFQNINDFQKNKIILDDISEIINENDIKNKIYYIFRIYNKIKDKKENSEKTFENININNKNKDIENQEEYNKYKQLYGNNEQKYLEGMKKYDKPNKKYDKLFDENQKAIEEKNKLINEMTHKHEKEKKINDNLTKNYDEEKKEIEKELKELKEKYEKELAANKEMVDSKNEYETKIKDLNLKLNEEKNKDKKIKELNDKIEELNKENIYIIENYVIN